MVEPLAVFLVTRLALAFLAYASQVFLPLNEAAGVWRASPDQRSLDGWLRWDSGWHLLVASHGYSLLPDGRLAPVLPVYPALIWLGEHLLPVRAPVVALLISNAAFAGALVLVYWLVRRRVDGATALRTVLLLCLFPFSFYYVAAYADSLTLLLAAAAFVRVERDDYRAAFLLAALAALTTPSGLALWPAALVTCFVARRRPVLSLDGLSALLPPAAVLALGYYLLSSVGASPEATLSVIAGPIRYGLLRDGLAAINPSAFTFGSYGLALLAALVLGLGALLLARSTSRLLGAGYAVFVVLVILRPLAGGLDALGRDLIVAFPVFVAASRRLRAPQAETLALVGCALFLGLFTALFASWYPTDRLSPLPSPTEQEIGGYGASGAIDPEGDALAWRLGWSAIGSGADPVPAGSLRGQP